MSSTFKSLMRRMLKGDVSLPGHSPGDGEERREKESETLAGVDKSIQSEDAGEGSAGAESADGADAGTGEGPADPEEGAKEGGGGGPLGPSSSLQGTSSHATTFSKSPLFF